MSIRSLTWGDWKIVFVIQQFIYQFINPFAKLTWQLFKYFVLWTYKLVFIIMACFSHVVEDSLKIAIFYSPFVFVDGFNFQQWEQYASMIHKSMFFHLVSHFDIISRVCLVNCNNLFFFFLLQWTQEVFHILNFIDGAESWMQEFKFNFPFPFYFLLFDFVSSILGQCQLICWCAWCNLKLVLDACILTHFHVFWLGYRFLWNV